MTDNLFKDDVTRREAMKTALKGAAYAAPVVLAATVPGMVSAASPVVQQTTTTTPGPTTTTTTSAATTTTPGPTTTTTTTPGPTHTLPPSADIAIAKTVDNPSPSLLSGAVTFTVTVTNLGPSPATGVMVTDNLPRGFVPFSNTVTQGTFDPFFTGIFDVGALAVNAVATLTITGLPGFAPITNTARRTASSPADPNAANDSASVTVTPTGTVTFPPFP